MKNFKLSGRTALIFGVGLIPPVAVISLVLLLAARTQPAFQEIEISSMMSTVWAPEADAFGIMPLVTGTLFCATLSTVLCILIGVPAAVRLAFFASASESRMNVLVLTVLSSLPSVLVGLMCLELISRYFGLSVASGVVALFLMTWPSFTLLFYARLRQQGSHMVDAAKALGIPERKAVYRLVLLKIRGDLTLATTFTLGKAAGEAMAISFVIGNVPHTGFFPDLLEAAHTLTTMVLKSHGAASDEQLGMVYVAILVLGALIICVNALGTLLASKLITNR